MKLRVILTLCLSAIMLGATAETHYKSHVAIGGHAGMSMSRMSFSPSVPQGWLTTPNVGVQVSYAEEKLVGLLAELNFTQSGWKETFDDNPGLSYKRTLSYLELPVMTHITVGTKRVKWIFNLGPQIGYMLSNSASANFDYSKPAASGIEATRHCEQMSMPVKNRFDYGICAGTGVEIWLQPRHSIYIEGRFYYGLNSIFGSSKSDVFSASRPMSLAFTAGYNFRLK